MIRKREEAFIIMSEMASVAENYQQQQQQQQYELTCLQPSVTTKLDGSFYMLPEPANQYILESHQNFSSEQSGALGRPHVYVGQHSSHPYEHNRYCNVSGINTKSPETAVQCKKCRALFVDMNLLAEHINSSHPGSPDSNTYPAPTQQQQQLGGSSPYQQQQLQPLQHMHASPPQIQINQLPQQPSYDFTGPTGVKNDAKSKPEEQACFEFS